MVTTSGQNGNWGINTSAAGAVALDSDAGKILINNGTTWVTAAPYQPSVEELERHDAYNLAKELRIAEHKERLEALKTVFPRGYQPIADFETMVAIAREDQLNPLYETVLKEFEDAQTALHRAANKLASAVKLTDSETIAERASKTDADFFAAKMAVNSSYGHLTGAAAAMSNPNTSYMGHTLGSGLNAGMSGPMGPPGAMGAIGPKGDKGDPGVDGKDAVIDEGLIKRLIRKVLGESK